ncbi:prephenate dehydrogenase/arogenate dehydrogenase family protein [Aquisalimonas sp. 2447]|uniref:prephenate dehydrogenase n=1 Tax=Aquisalimonas sp. 2447 TaxID=2740807 RepID=UPI001432614D|nr:prephenate dehydrogenase/arogenate dehydrogenase family protein [Aquisalimonas sp. 2447]QIT54632.1 prephenate dehydrogenase/arogenate dehydrogenase family protein [Aquisalimonas sp. 2447]
MAAAGLQSVALIGVGLIGGSWALGLREAGLVDGTVTGCGRSLDNLETARERGIIDHATTDLRDAVGGADLVVLSVPLGAVRGVLETIRDDLADHAIVTDVGSAKQCVVDDARQVLGDAASRFVPGHPIAGNEKSGAAAAFPELFRGRRVILTPEADTERAAVERVRALWEAVGASVACMTAAHHDDVLAATSHLPHMLAYSLVDTLSRWSDRDEVFAYAAGGFRDFTRIASSDPEMWRDICLANREALLEAMERYMADLQELREAVRHGDGDRLEAVFSHAKATRDRFVAMLES